MVFPGQVLNIPPQPPTPPPAPAVKEIKKKVVKPLVEESEIFEQQFIKVNVRHITDGSGVVIGSLLITPKMVMFNPNEGDLLVQESEPDNYQLILPFELLVNIAIFKDFSRFNSTIGIANKEENSNDLFEDTGKDTDGEKENKGEEEKTLYMRLVMGKPIAKKLPRSTPVVSYGTQDLQPEYWFLLKGVTARKLHSFIINDLCPDKYGLLDHMEIGRRGYEVLRTGTAVFEDDSGKGCNRETVSQMFQNQMQMASFDVECITEQIGSSDIFEPPERERISRELPPKATGFNWELGYSTSEHGFNLHSLYRKMQKFEGPCLLLIQDIGSQNVFGAYLTARPQMSEHFLGTGETFVFTLRPKFEAFHWTGENDFFMKGEPTSKNKGCNVVLV